jgi:probable HAF family extracellular repeat protein
VKPGVWFKSPNENKNHTPNGSPRLSNQCNCGTSANAQKYKVIFLGTFGGDQTVATAINDLDDVVGYSQLPGNITGSQHAFLYRNGKLIDLDPNDQYSVLRLEKAKPLLEQINTGIQAARAGALPQSALAKACNYTLTLWTRLGRFLEYPEVELSNNLAENAMRPVVLGRKNWIHVGSKDAGPRIAAIISIVETCRRLSLPIRDYLASVLPGLADFPRNRVAQLIPSAWAAKVKGSKSGGAGPVFV